LTTDRAPLVIINSGHKIEKNKSLIVLDRTWGQPFVPLKR